MSERKNGTTRNQESKKYSQSFSVLKPPINNNVHANRGLLPMSHGNSKNMLKIETK